MKIPTLLLVLPLVAVAVAGYWLVVAYLRRWLEPRVERWVRRRIGLPLESTRKGRSSDG